jgi:hypothetical protein
MKMAEQFHYINIHYMHVILILMVLYSLSKHVIHLFRYPVDRYNPVQKVSDLRPGKNCVSGAGGGGAQFLVPFKVGPL